MVAWPSAGAVMARRQALRALVARVPCGRAAASGIRARAHSSGVGRGQRRGEAARRQRVQRAHGQRRSEARAGGALKCLRARRAERGGSARERERRERKGVEREIKVSGLTWSKLKIFN